MRLLVPSPFQEKIFNDFAGHLSNAIVYAPVCDTCTTAYIVVRGQDQPQMRPHRPPIASRQMPSLWNHAWCPPAQFCLHAYCGTRCVGMDEERKQEEWLCSHHKLCFRTRAFAVHDFPKSTQVQVRMFSSDSET
jgi:hypothetical protein